MFSRTRLKFLFLQQRVITCDETCVYNDEIKTKTQSFQWKLSEKPTQNKSSQVLSDEQVNFLFSGNGIVRHEFFPCNVQLTRRTIYEFCPFCNTGLQKEIQLILLRYKTPEHITLLSNSSWRNATTLFSRRASLLLCPISKIPNYTQSITFFNR